MVRFSPDSRHIASASEDKTIRIWDAQSGKMLAALQQSDHVTSVAFSPDGKRMVAAGKHVLSIWGLATSHLRHSPDSGINKK
jgi:WD40 repeat protein